MILPRLALKSLVNRRLSVSLTVLAIALSVALLLGVERLRTEARTGFANTISGTDLVVGARSGGIQLLLYSVFHIGDATNNISWESYLDISSGSGVAWTVPISLGDSHRGYRVVGTTADYFEHYRYARGRRLELVRGGVFADVYDAVIGAEVAEVLGYELNQEIIIAHGAGEVSFMNHADKPFHVTGVLARTGTPIDRSVLVPLEGIEAIHIDWQGGAPMPGLSISAEQTQRMDLTPREITAVLVGLESKLGTFKVQRRINDYPKEPLLAILPGVALQQLWDLMRVAENALLAISAMVVAVGLTGMVTVMLTSLNERRREIAILRSVGARPMHVLLLLVGETAALTLTGIGLGLVVLYGTMAAVRPLLEGRFGLFLTLGPPSLHEWLLMSAVVLAGVLAGLVPAWRAYRYALHDGLTIRL